ncbi:MAG: translocation protein TolB [Acidobacteriia bacterium]|nr:translocation protein TolB [Terriglobia bacterium]
MNRRPPLGKLRGRNLEENVLPHRKLAGSLLLLTALLLGAWPAAAQDWFRTGTGLGVEKPRVAVADFAPRSGAAQPHSKLFTDVVREDLQFSGILDLVSPSFYPKQVPSVPAELKPLDWNEPPASAHLAAFGNLSESPAEVAIEAWLYDVRNTSAPAVVGKVYRGAPTDAQVRKFAHQFADEIVSKLSGGLPGVAATQIAFVSTRTGAKELWVMDYDGANQRPLTSLRSISLTPRWSPDASRIAFTCYAAAYGVVSPQICMFSMDTGHPVAMPRFRGTNSAPAWSPDGSQIIFSSSMQGTPELFVMDANGNRPKRLTFASGASTSPAWNPKTGQTVAFVSDRGGIPQLYMMNADGTNAQKMDLPDMGYVIDPAWSPNGQLLAFSWRRPNGNYDLYVMEAATRQIVELTRDAGRNERPSWAPDGRHLVFESTRGGSRQIWEMLADGTQARQLTQTGANESPNWSQK